MGIYAMPYITSVTENEDNCEIKPQIIYNYALKQVEQ